MRWGSVPKEIKMTENQRNKDEKVFDPLDLKPLVTCMIRPPSLCDGEGIPWPMISNTFPFKTEPSDGNMKVLISLV